MENKTMNPPVLVVKENLELRTLKPIDAQSFFEIIRKNNIHLRQWFGWLDDDKTVADTEKYIIESNKRFANKEGLDLAIFYKGEQVGGIGLFPWDTAHKKVSIAYWLAEEFQGKGIMTDSLNMVVEYAFTVMDLNRIEIAYAVGNTKSAALPKKLGFTFEGIAREAEWLYDHFVDLKVYSLLAKDWRGRKQHEEQ
jgi:ribosomal-protein-serine acetyltransferase